MVTGLTADIFVQLTTTLAHLSGLKNRTNSANLSLPFDLTPKGRKGLTKPQPSPLTSHLKVGMTLANLSLPFHLTAKGRKDLIKPQPSPLTSLLKIGMT